jgi:predicted translation initiation factor SUI1
MIGLPYVAEINSYSVPFIKPEITADRLIVVCLPEESATIKEILEPGACSFELWDMTEKQATKELVSGEVNGWIARLITGAPRLGPPDLTPLPQKVIASPTVQPINKKQVISVGRETKGRKGKGVTILSDLPMNEEQIHELATTLKSKCGTGGTVKDGKIEIQGDQRERIIIELEKLGFKTKKVGG